MEAHQSGSRDYSSPLWTLLMFEAFLRQVVDGTGSALVNANQSEAVAVGL